MDEVVVEQQQEEIQQKAQESISEILVNGQPFTKLPDDLYIPPEALEVFLETFAGPLDLLLYLIRRQNLDILDIPISKITAQYIQYIELMQTLNLELAAEYLVMAAMLAEIKSRMLLPKPTEEEGDEEDPRAELVRRLQEYQRFKEAAIHLDELPRRGRDTFMASASTPQLSIHKPEPTIEVQELIVAFAEVMKRAKLHAAHHVQREPLSVRDRMKIILDQLHTGEFVPFTVFFNFDEGRMGVVVTFIAILELLRGSVIEIVQSQPFSPIHVRAVVVSNV